MKMVTVPVMKVFTYEGREYRPGETVDLSPVHATIEARNGHVSLSIPAKTRTIQNRQMVAEPAKAARQRGRPRTYRRADMTAED